MRHVLPTLLLAVLLALSVPACSGRHASSPTAQHSEARRRVANGATLVDVRTPAEFAEGHIDGAINIPLQELPTRLAELPDKGHDVVLYCRSGRRSNAAATLLTEAGYTAVYDLGPMSAW